MPLHTPRFRGFRGAQLLVTCTRLLSHVDLNNPKPVFQPKRVLLLTKVTRYDFERSLVEVSDEDKVRSVLRRKGINVDALWARHRVHHEKVAEFKRQLDARGLEVQVVNRLEYTADAVNWADVIFTAGGDGTFLLGAHKIRNRDKLIVGLNTDPEFSAGCLCLPQWCTWNFSKVLDLLYNGRFRPFWRNRIRVTLIHDRDFVPQIQIMNKRKPVSLSDWNHSDEEHTDSYDPQGTRSSPFSSGLLQNSLVPAGLQKYMTQTTLPIRALNEVFFGETLSARVSHYDISIDGEKYVRQKSSGVTCATGTGSSSWFYQINRLSAETVADLLAIAKRIGGLDENVHSKPQHSMSVRSYSLRGYPTPMPKSTEPDDLDEWHGSIPSLAHKVADQFNASIPIPPNDLRMAYVVRDPLCNAVFNVSKPRGLATQMQIRSTMLDAHIVFDAGWTYPLHYGAVVDLSVAPTDALCCLSLMDAS